MSKLKIALLSGGISGEREVSLKTGDMIFDALDKEKYEIFRYDPKIDLRRFFMDAMNKKFELVFPALHGPFGEDGKLQGMLDMIAMPYVFSGCLASALAMNKLKTKIIAQSLDIKTVKHAVIEKRGGYSIENLIEKLGLPVVIKPVELGSSVGMTIAKNQEELEKGIDLGFEYDHTLMLEQFKKGRELTSAIMEIDGKLKALPIVEILPKASEWFDYKAKYEPGASEEICPANIPDELKEDIQNISKKMFKAVGCKSLARADFIWNEESNKLYFLEINTIPGMTATSLAPQAAKADGMEFSVFLDKLIEEIVKK